MDMETIAAVLHEPGGELRLQTVVLDDLKADEIRIRIEACGICHTDIGSQGILAMPAILGHEGVGIVEQIGSGVNSVSPGDRVIISYGFCNNCPNCYEGKPYVCDHSVQSNFAGTRLDGSHTTTLDGKKITASFFQQSSFATQVITPVRNTIKIEEDIPAHILAPLGCGIMTGAGAVLNTLQVPAGKSLVIFGAGTVGLSAIMAAKIAGAYPLIAVDVNEKRLQLAAELGASHCINGSDNNTVAQIIDICPRGAAFSFETSGVESALNDAIGCLAMAGQCGMVTTPHYGEKYPFTPFGIFIKAASLHGVFFGSSVPNTFLRQIIEFYQQGRFPYDKLIKTYSFDDINTAMADTKSGDVIKPVVMMA